MRLDIRIPIGAFFSFLGVLLAGYGWLAARAIERRSLGVNIDLWWGLVLLLFGVAMLMFAWRSSARARQMKDQ